MYSEIKIYGNCDVNYVWTKRSNTSDESIKKTILSGIHSPQWDLQTSTLATFTEDLSASDFSQSRPITGYIVLRRNTKDNIEYKVADLPNDYHFISDYNVKSDNSYEYKIFPVYQNDNGKNVLGEPLITPQTGVELNGVMLASLVPTDNKDVYMVDTNDIWTFSLDIDDINFSPQTQKSIVTGLGRYAKAYTTKPNYVQADISCYIGDIDCSGTQEYFGDDVDKIERWTDFCNNGKLKLYRDAKGHIFPCEIETMSYVVQNSTKEMPTKTSFKIVQLDDYKNISAYSVEV